jgi:hypothetical protein
MAIQDRDREEWFFHPVTQEFLGMLWRSRNATMETWAQEGFVTGDPEMSSLVNAKALGGISMLDQTIEAIQQYKPESQTDSAANNETEGNEQWMQ